jgi:cytochrome P450
MNRSEDRCPFDHYSKEYAANRWEILKDLRDEDPVSYSDQHGGFVVVSRYEDVATVTRDNKTFSSGWLEGDEIRRGILIPQTPYRMGFIEMDPPESLKYRHATLPFFTPTAVDELQPQIWRIVDQAIDDFIETGHCDVVREFTDRVPAMTTLTLLGLSTEKWREYVDFFHHVTGASYEERNINDVGNWVMQDMSDAVEERRSNPRDDMITKLINTDIDGEPMRNDMAVESLMLMMVGGLDTTSALLANSLYYLHENPSDRQRLIGDPSLIPVAGEEFLRAFTPVQALVRNVTEDTVLGGVALKAGTRVLVSWASANRDEREFPQAEDVVLDRFPNRHQSFGLGKHRCIGSHLARSEFEAALGAVLRRLGGYRVVEEGALRYENLGINNGWVSMEIEFTPGTRVLETGV